MPGHIDSLPRDVETVTCQYCGAQAFLVERRVILGAGNDPVWYCPVDNAWVGCHPGTANPLGSLADADLRYLRYQAHRSLDALWMYSDMSRSEAYKKLAELMGLTRDECHIGMFDESQCRMAMRVLEAYDGGKEAVARQEVHNTPVPG